MSKTLRIPPFLTRYQLVNARVPISVSAARGLTCPMRTDWRLLLSSSRTGGSKRSRPERRRSRRQRRFSISTAGIVLPTFTDAHTHLDKGHIWPRRRNPDGSFASALLACKVRSGKLERCRSSRPHAVRSRMRLCARHLGVAHAYRFDVAADRDLLADLRRIARRLARAHRRCKARRSSPSSSRSTTLISMRSLSRCANTRRWSAP